MANTASTKLSGNDSAGHSATTPTSNLPTLPQLDDDLPTLDTSATLSRLTPLDLALKSSLSTPTPSSPDITTETARTAQELQYLRGLLAKRPKPYHALTPEQLEVKTFKWLVLDLICQEFLEREIEKLDILCDEQILSTLYKAPLAHKEIIQKDIEKRKVAFEKRVEKTVEEAAADMPREMKVEPEGWDVESEGDFWMA